MNTKTLVIAALFGDNQKTEFIENFHKWESSFCLTLNKMPNKDTLLASLPPVSVRDSWRLRMLSEAEEDLFDIRKGNDIDTVYDTNKLQPYIDSNVRLVYTLDKSNTDGVLTVYDLHHFLLYIKDLTVTGFYNAVYKNMHERLVMEIWGDDYELFETASISVIKRGEVIPSIEFEKEKRKRTDICGQHCQWTTKLPNLLPDDLHIIECKKGGELASLFKQACLLLSVCYVADFSSVEKSSWKIRISGFKTLITEGKKPKVSDLAHNEASVNQWFDIYDWCYTGGYTSDRLAIARNIISLNCYDNSLLKLNESTLGAIKSNFRIFELDSVRQYIKVRKEVSNDLLALQDKINTIVDGFTGDFRKSVVGLGTFFLTLVVVRVVAGGHWYEPFSNQIIVLSLLFLGLSLIVLIYSRKTLVKKEQLYYKHYGQLRERYEQLLSKEEADKIFEDDDPNKLGTHSNYIQWQKKTYTWIWALTLLGFFFFLLIAWCHNLLETTNICKIFKFIISCCIKNI